MDTGTSSPRLRRTESEYYTPPSESPALPPAQHSPALSDEPSAYFSPARGTAMLPDSASASGSSRPSSQVPAKDATPVYQSRIPVATRRRPSSARSTPPPPSSSASASIPAPRSPGSEDIAGPSRIPRPIHNRVLSGSSAAGAGRSAQTASPRGKALPPGPIDVDDEFSPRAGKVSGRQSRKSGTGSGNRSADSGGASPDEDRTPQALRPGSNHARPSSRSPSGHGSRRTSYIIADPPSDGHVSASSSPSQRRISHQRRASGSSLGSPSRKPAGPRENRRASRSSITSLSSLTSNSYESAPGKWAARTDGIATEGRSGGESVSGLSTGTDAREITSRDFAEGKMPPVKVEDGRSQHEAEQEHDPDEDDEMDKLSELSSRLSFASSVGSFDPASHDPTTPTKPRKIRIPNRTSSHSSLTSPTIPVISPRKSSRMPGSVSSSASTSPSSAAPAQLVAPVPLPAMPRATAGGGAFNPEPRRVSRSVVETPPKPDRPPLDARRASKAINLGNALGAVTRMASATRRGGVLQADETRMSREIAEDDSDFMPGQSTEPPRPSRAGGRRGSAQIPTSPTSPPLTQFPLRNYAQYEGYHGAPSAGPSPRSTPAPRDPSGAGDQPAYPRASPSPRLQKVHPGLIVDTSPPLPAPGTPSSRRMSAQPSPPVPARNPLRSQLPSRRGSAADSRPQSAADDAAAQPVLRTPLPLSMDRNPVSSAEPSLSLSRRDARGRNEVDLTDDFEQQDQPPPPRRSAEATRRDTLGRVDMPDLTDRHRFSDRSEDAEELARSPVEHYPSPLGPAGEFPARQRPEGGRATDGDEDEAGREEEEQSPDMSKRRSGDFGWGRRRRGGILETALAFARPDSGVSQDGGGETQVDEDRGPRTKVSAEKILPVLPHEEPLSMSDPAVAGSEGAGYLDLNEDSPETPSKDTLPSPVRAKSPSLPLLGHGSPPTKAARLLGLPGQVPLRSSTDPTLLPPPMLRSPTSPNIPTPSSGSGATTAPGRPLSGTLSKRSHLIREIAMTERSYANDLALIRDAYIGKYLRPTSVHSIGETNTPGTTGTTTTADGSARSSSSTFTYQTAETKRSSASSQSMNLPPVPGWKNSSVARTPPIPKSPSAVADLGGGYFGSARSISTSAATSPLTQSVSNSTASASGNGAMGPPVGKPLSPADLRAIFLNIEQLAAAADDLAADFERAIGSEESGPGSMPRDGEAGADRLGEVFNQHLPRLRSLFTFYCARQSTASARLVEVQSDPGCAAWLIDRWNSIKPHTHAWNLDSMLIKPVQRITKYPLLFDDLLRATTPVHPDYFNIRSAAEQSKAVAMEIDEAKRRKDVVAGVINKKPTTSLPSGSGLGGLGLGSGVGGGSTLNLSTMAKSGNKKGLKLFRNKEKGMASSLSVVTLQNLTSPSSTTLTPSVTSSALSFSSMDLPPDVSPSSHAEYRDLVNRVDEADTVTRRVGKEVIMYTAATKEVWVSADGLARTWGKVVQLEKGVDPADKRLIAWRGIVGDLLEGAWAEMNAEVKGQIMPALSKLLDATKNPRKVITKCDARSADYARFSQLRDRQKMLDRTLLESAHEFVALHTQLIEELPTFLDAYARIFDLTMNAFAAVQARFHDRVRTKLISFSRGWIAPPKQRSSPRTGRTGSGAVVLNDDEPEGEVPDIATARGIVKAWHDSWAPYAEAMDHFQITRPSRSMADRLEKYNDRMGGRAGHAHARSSPRSGSPLGASAGSGAGGAGASGGTSPGTSLRHVNSRSSRRSVRSEASQPGSPRGNSPAPPVPALPSGAGSVPMPVPRPAESGQGHGHGLGHNRSRSASLLGASASKPLPTPTPNDYESMESFGVVPGSRTHSHGLNIPHPRPGHQRSESASSAVSAISAVSAVSFGLPRLSAEMGHTFSGLGLSADSSTSAGLSRSATAAFSAGTAGQDYSALGFGAGSTGGNRSTSGGSPARAYTELAHLASAPGGGGGTGRGGASGRDGYQTPPHGGAAVAIVPPTPPMPDQSTFGVSPSTTRPFSSGQDTSLRSREERDRRSAASSGSGFSGGTSSSRASGVQPDDAGEGWRNEKVLYQCHVVADFDPSTFGSRRYRKLRFLPVYAGDVVDVYYEVGRIDELPAFPYPEIGVENDGLLVARVPSGDIGLVICSFLEPIGE